MMQVPNQIWTVHKLQPLAFPSFNRGSKAIEFSMHPLKFLQLNEDVTVGVEAFSRITPAVPIIANVIVSENIFEVLATSNGGRLQFSIFGKYLTRLERAIKKVKTQSESSILSVIRSARREKILEVDGTVTT